MVSDEIFTTLHSYIHKEHGKYCTTATFFSKKVTFLLKTHQKSQLSAKIVINVNEIYINGSEIYINVSDF